MIQHLFPLITA